MPPLPLTLIAAVARHGVIGIDNRLPWHLPEDLKHFKALTLGQAVIMGRKTWESLPPRFRPLPGRINIVLTRDTNWRATGATAAHDLAAAIALAGTAIPCVIGGAEIYRQALPLASRLELTEIDADFPGNAHFPDFDRNIWHATARESHRSETGLAFGFVTYEKSCS